MKAVHGLFDFLSSLGLFGRFISASICLLDHIQKLLQTLCQMLMAVMLPGNKVFFGICQDKLLWSNIIKLFFVCVFLFPSKSSSPLPHDLSPFSGKVRQEEEPI